MFVRINKSGKRRYLQVVESYRNEAGQPRHRVVANLGRIDSMEDRHLDTLIRGLCRVAGRDVPAALEITHASAKAFGDVFALHELWKDLGFDRALGRALRSVSLLLNQLNQRNSLFGHRRLRFRFKVSQPKPFPKIGDDRQRHHRPRAALRRRLRARPPTPPPGTLPDASRQRVTGGRILRNTHFKPPTA